MINEDDLIAQLQALIDDLDIKTVPMREKITEELNRVKEFEQMFLGNKTVGAVKDIDVRNYAKFVLQEGSMEEKREFIRCLKSEIVLTNRNVHLK